MPVRKIPRSHQNITGQISSLKSVGAAAFESSLERDFYILLDFNCLVNRFEVQPCRIDYQDGAGHNRSYTPDVLVSYRVPGKIKVHKTILYEIKYRSDLREHWSEWKPKFKAAYSYAKFKGWIFKIITEREVRTPYLDNVKFLRKYDVPIEDDRINTALRTIDVLGETDPQTLATALALDFSNKAEAIYLIWQLVARGYIATDFTRPLTMKSCIWRP